ncbi:MAG: hypothetical protein JXA11_11680 [Phycisphaerae bacterium]|nr:hypothetical protein [Phycisphaerae bacterium]
MIDDRNLDAYFTGQPLRIGNETQLLIDDYIVEDRWRLTRVLQQPHKFPRNPILTLDRSWEGDMVYFPYVLWDEDFGRYRMWYRCYSTSNYFGAGGPPYYFCYAESDDGIHWEKPLLKVCDFPGFTETNVVYCGTHFKRAQGIQVIKVPNPESPDKRYMMVCLECRPHGDYMQSGVNIIYSPDGLTWSLPDGPHILDYHSDCSNHMVFDPVEEQWILYCRPIYMFGSGRKELRGNQEGGRHMRRRVAAMTSKDLVNWSYPRTILYPDERDAPDYDACMVFRYGNQFLMFYKIMQGDTDGVMDTCLASSRDGLHWERFHTRKPYLPRGQKDQWDAGMCCITCPPVQQGEKLFLYYTGTMHTGHEEPTAGGCGLAITKVDRFVEQRAGNEPAYLLTREFILEGNRLHLNVGYSYIYYATQQLKVEIARHPPLGGHGGRDKANQVVEGFSLDDCDPIKADRTDVVVTWKGNSDLSSLIGKPIYLRFEIQNMGLYSFRIEK